MKLLSGTFIGKCICLLLLIITVTSLNAQIDPAAPDPVRQGMSNADPVRPLGRAVQFRESGKYGLRNEATHQVLLPAIYESVTKVKVKGQVFRPLSVNEQVFLVKKDGKYGVYNNLAEERLAIIYDQITSSFVVYNGKKGMINLDGVESIPFEYDYLTPARQVYIVKKENNYGVISKTGASVLPIQYSNIENPFLTHYLYITNAKNKIWILDLSKMQYVSQTAFDSVELIKLHEPKCDVSHRDIAKYACFEVQKAEKKGYLMPDGKMLLPISFESIKPIVNCKEVLAFVLKTEGQFALANAQGEVSKLVGADELRYLQRNRFAFSKNGKEGLVGIDGKVLAEAKYDYISYFGNITTRVELNGKQGSIDLNGQLVEPISKAIGYNGYTKLDDLFKAFTVAIKSNDDAQLLAFAKAICVDQETINFMGPLNLKYRGIPNHLISKGITIDKLQQDYYASLKQFSDRLKMQGALENLTYLGPVHTETTIFDERFNIRATETMIRLEAGERLMKSKLGELLLIDGVWKVFTRPKL